MSDSQQAAAGDASADRYALTSRDAGLCVVFVVLYSLPWIAQLLREAVVAAGVLLASIGPGAVAIIVIPVAAAGYFILRARISWGWRAAAICAALVLWAVACKFLLIGHVAIGVSISPANLATALAAGAVALGVFRWGRDRHLPYVACAIGAVSAGLALRQLFYGPLISDVYLFQQGLWNTLHGEGLFHVSDEGGSHFGTHWSPVLFLLLPIYALWPSPVPLILTQSAALAAAAFPVHALLRRRWPEGEALALTTGFLLLPSLLGSTLWQYHEAAYGLAAFLAALLYFERRRSAPFAAFAFATLLVKETWVIPVALFSVYAAARRRGWRWVVLPAAGAAVYGALAFGVIMPRFHNPESDRPFRSLYGYLGASPGAAARDLAAHPSRALRLLTRGRNRAYLETVSAPEGYVAPLGAWPVVFGVPDAVAVLLARPSPWPVRDPTSHYSMLIAAALVISFGYAVSSAARRTRSSRTPAALAAGLFFMVAATQGAAAVARYTSVLPPAAVAARRQLVAMVPRDASVVSTWAAAPYLANRRTIYQEREGTLERVRAQYYLTYRHVETPHEKAGLRAKGWELVAEKAGFSLWRRVGRGRRPGGS